MIAILAVFLVAGIAAALIALIEAGLIVGLTGAGIPQDQAVAAVLIQRLFTAYLPPIWGFVTLTWMRRREYV
jgi:glycosyltransferase 2 family protein